jgi:hypothetical protein
MKQLFGLVRLGALTALSVAFCGAHHQAEAIETAHNDCPKKLDRQAEPKGELVLLGLDGTVIAREIDLVPRTT